MAPKTLAAPACRNCGRALTPPAQVGWECDCGIRVCTDPDCFTEWFKRVADGEATRCLSCGNVV